MLVSIASILDPATGTKVSMRSNGNNSLGVNVKDNVATLEINGKAIPVDPTFATEMQKVLISVSEGLEVERIKARRSRRLAKTLEKIASIPIPFPTTAATRIGRPKGSKNKPKEATAAIPVQVSTPAATTSNTRIGRPPGSKNKPKVAPVSVPAAPVQTTTKRIGRPPGSKNKPKLVVSAPTPAVPVPVALAVGAAPAPVVPAAPTLPAWIQGGKDPNSPR